MRVPSFLGLGLAALALAPRPALAAGVALSAASGERVDVVHNTIASFSDSGSSLVEQVLWQGDGASATLWILPIRLDAEVSYSTDALVNTFDQSLSVTVRQPPNSCFVSSGFNECDGVSVGGGVGGSSGNTLPTADPVVWPSSSASFASYSDLEAWLAGFSVTPAADLAASFQAAEAAGYGFHAVELPASSSLSSSPVVRISSGEAVPAVMPALALRAGAEVNLTVIADRRYAPAEQPAAIIAEGDLEWSWTEMGSNYYSLAGDAIAAGWLTEAGEPLSPYAFDKLISLAESDPQNSGYDLAEPDPSTAAHADADALRAGLSAGSSWVTRLTTRVAEAGFPLEVELAPVDSLATVDRDLTPAIETGAIPSCEVDSSSCDFDEGMGDMGDDTADCSASHSRTAAVGGFAWALLALLVARLGRSRRV